jgi:fructose-specific phosphotransferase system IIC component
MAGYESESIAGLLKSVLADTRELIREELSLARAELRQEIAEVRTAGIAFASSAVIALLGVTLLCVAIGGAIAYAFGWPSWTGYGIVAVLLLVAAAVFVSYGKRQIADLRALPKTRETIKENIAWIQSNSERR